MKNSTIFTFTVVAASSLVWITLHEEKKALRLARVIPVAGVETAQVAETSKPFEVQTRAPSSIAPTQVEVATDTATDATTLRLHLNEEILGTMEHAGPELRQYAAAEPTSAGWRIELYPGDKVFAKAGFHNGEVVSLADLQSHSDNAEQARLAQRLVDILRKIER